MPAYHEIFLTGENVEVKDVYYLEEFIKDGVILPAQLAFSRMHFKILDTSFHHGGEVLYTLGRNMRSGEIERIPGVWREFFLDDLRFVRRKVNAKKVFDIVPQEKNSDRYVIVYDSSTGMELFVTRQPQNEEYAEAMKCVAEVRDAAMFARRYGFSIHGLACDRYPLHTGE